MVAVPREAPVERFAWPPGTVAALLLVMAAVTLCYANSVTGSFISDDVYVVQLNRDPFNLRSIVKCFLSCDYLVVPDPTPYYRPLNRLSYILERHFFGLNPAGYHVVSILLHAISSMLVCLTLLRLRCALLPSLGATLLFALHPVNSEAVNLLAARNNILATIFVLSSYLVFRRADEMASKSGYLLSGVLFFCGTLCKETALMFLPLLFAVKTLKELDPGKPKRLLTMETGYILPHVLFLVLYLGLRHMAIDTPLHLAGVIERLGKLVYIFPKYLALLVWPFNQSFSYAVPDDFRPLIWPLAAGWGVIAALAWYLFTVRNNVIAFGSLWLILNVLPISNIIPIPSVLLADRYLYIPLVGMTVLVADRLQHLGGTRALQRGRMAAVVFLVIVCGLLTVRRNRDWRDSLSFVSSIVRENPGNAVARYLLGYERFLRGEPGAARIELETSLKLGTSFTEAAWPYYYLAVLALKDHDDGRAVRLLQTAGEVGRVRPPLHFLLGSLYGRRSSPDAAREYARFLQSVMPDSSHLIPEALDGLRAAQGVAPLAARPATVALPGSWVRYHRFASGTELLYDAASIRTTAGERTVAARHRLASRDRLGYAMKFIRFPLATTAEVRYQFRINCREHVYKTTWAEFLDREGKVLGVFDTEREDYVKYLFPLQDTPMDRMLHQVCSSREPAGNPDPAAGTSVPLPPAGSGN
jgi:hypothetical protein